MKSKLLIYLFCGILSVTACNKIERQNDSTIASGTAGPLTWVLSMDGVLIIDGKGEMPDYSFPANLKPPWYKYKDDITDVVIGNEIIVIGATAFRAFEKITSVVIGNSVTDIGFSAFAGCHSLTSVVIPNSVTNIGASAFHWCYSLTSVTIGNSVTAIGDDAFTYCTSLTEIVNYQEIPQILSNSWYMGVPSSVFLFVNKVNCKLLVPVGSLEAYRTAEVWKDFCKTGIIDDPDSIITGGPCTRCMPNIACGETGPLTWTLNNDGALTVSGIGEMPRYTGIRGIYPPWNQYKDEIVHVEIDEGVSRIGFWAFYYYNNLSSVTIGSSVNSIGGGAFAGCKSLTSVTIPNSVTSIEHDAFNGCSGITSISIGSSVTSIGIWAFRGCHSLTEIVNYQETPQIIDSYINPTTYQFVGVDMVNCILFVPAGSLEAYKTAKGWKDFANIKEIK